MSADQGDSDAYYYLGTCYYNGKGVNKDYKKAFKYY
jgi:TPR repeat protein